ncbi:MAG: sigma-70 family RNA polymerase sigma factor [Planctomycetes bacterium]|nr:sigma-70 family RNA polymerase sigma factor [Planctomycetota bacterium]
MATEAELLQRAVVGDREAITELLQAAGPGVRQDLHGAVPKRWQSLLSVDDVLQQTYTDAFLGISRFANRGEGSFGRWLNMLARRNLIDAIRMLEAEKRGGEAQKRAAVRLDDSQMALYDWLIGTSGTPSRFAAREEAVAAIGRAVESLPPLYQQVVSLYDLEGRPIAEVAAALNRSPGAVYMLRARAHDQLRELMGSATGYLSDTA